MHEGHCSSEKAPAVHLCITVSWGSRGHLGSATAAGQFRHMHSACAVTMHNTSLTAASATLFAAGLVRCWWCS
jgi:hypothetical protein